MTYWLILILLWTALSGWYAWRLPDNPYDDIKPICGLAFVYGLMCLTGWFLQLKEYLYWT